MMQAPRTPLAKRYRFLRSLQTGAKSVGWLAIDDQNHRTVIASALGAARIADLEGIVGVRHPHLATIVDVIHDPEPDSLPPNTSGLKSVAVAVAGYVPGSTLHEGLRSDRLESTEAVDIVEKLAQAVESLHAIGGVHGAISPRSVVVNPENGPTGPILTQLLAPPSGSYCSPERLQGHGPSAVDDTWALHATLYAALTGTTPFGGNSREKLVKRMVSNGVRPLAEHGIEDATLQEIVTRGLKPEPAGRCTDVVELRGALHAWRDSRTTVEQAPTTPGPPPIQPSDESDAEWDDEDERTIVGSTAKLLAMARQAGGATSGARQPLPTLDDTDEDDEALTSILDVSTFLMPLEVEGLRPVPTPRPASPSAPGPLPPPPSAPRAAPPPPAGLPRASQPGASVYTDNEEEEEEEEEATRIMDEDAVFGLTSDAVRSEPPPPAAVPTGFEVPTTQQMTPPTVSAPVEPPAADPGAGPGSEPAHESGILWWAVLTLLLACAVTAYLARDKLIPALAGLGLVSRPGAHTPDEFQVTPPGGTSATGTPASVPDTDGGSATALSNDATAPANPVRKSRPTSLPACVASYFLPGTFQDDEDFGFLCKDNDFRGVNSQLYRRIVIAGAGKVTPGMREWSTFDWYELAATAVIRHGCCPIDTKPIRLPQLGGPCEGLDKVLSGMVDTPPSPAEVTARTQAYAKGVSCMFQKGVSRPFHYGKRPLSANRAAFETFWQRAVTQYGQ